MFGPGKGKVLQFGICVVFRGFGAPNALPPIENQGLAGWTAKKWLQPTNVCSS
jgi:hypothetical protein